jgi:hypothetical protein
MAPRKLLYCGLAALSTGVFLLAQQVIPVEPPHESGQSVTAAYEGWFANSDGTFSILFGYYNRNTKEEFDIPAGPENRIEPGGPDQGQPTHFVPRRQWGIFTVTVPKDFGSKKLTWTIVANGQTTQVPAGLDLLWELQPFRDATDNTPPYIGFEARGPFVNGPRGQTMSLAGAVREPVTLNLWVADDANVALGAVRPRTPAVTLAWSKFRGPGEVKFSSERPMIENAEFETPGKAVFKGKATTTATFNTPGEYTLRVMANDWSGEGGRGFQCCWSNAFVRVSVRAAR